MMPQEREHTLWALRLQTRAISLQAGPGNKAEVCRLRRRPIAAATILRNWRP
jgi:hypothetical protein